MPISLLLSRHIESEKAKMEYQRLLENQKAIFKDRQIVSVKKYPSCLKKIKVIFSRCNCESMLLVHIQQSSLFSIWKEMPKICN